MRSSQNDVNLLLTAAGGGLATFPWFPPSLFNVLAGVVHSLTMWPHPWHLKHWSKLGSFILWTLPWPSLGPWVFPSLWGIVPILLPAEELWAEVVWPRPVQTLWELGQVGVFLTVHPLPWPQCMGLFGALAGWLLCSALVRGAISLVIWLLSSFELSTTSVVTADLALTLSFASTISLSALWTMTISCE